ncbi:MAG TPA: hypothetical protein ENO25_03360 [Desulfobacteraceae bacterium]|nr:hypothetical protein [Desulfobacteraceae bacterium]
MALAFSVLGLEIHVSTDCRRLERRLEHITVKADQDYPVTGVLAIEVQKNGGEYTVLEDGKGLVSSQDAEWITLYLHELINFRVSWRFRDCIKIHAASGSFRDKRFLLAGDKGSGKTTLITRMLFEGATVYGDETVVIEEGEIIPFPRKFHLKEGTLPLVPQLVPICGKLTSYPAYYGGRFYFFDPTDAGFEWPVRKGNLDVVFCLEPRHGRKTEIEECPKWSMVEKLMLQSSDFAENPETQIGRLCNLVDKSACVNLYFGELDRTVMLLQSVLLDLHKN